MTRLKNLGAKNRRLRFEMRSQPGADGLGVEQGDWNELATLWASVEPKRTGANETVLAARLTGTAGYTIRVAQSSLSKDIAPNCRAVDTRTNEIFNIRSKLDLEGTRLDWTLDAETGVET